MASALHVTSAVRSFSVESDIPANCAGGGVPIVAGIDEAGRGSVVGEQFKYDFAARTCKAHSSYRTLGKSAHVYPAGDMIYGIAFWPEDEDAEISKLGFQGALRATQSLSNVMRPADIITNHLTR